MATLTTTGSWNESRENTVHVEVMNDIKDVYKIEAWYLPWIVLYGAVHF